MIKNQWSRCYSDQFQRWAQSHLEPVCYQWANVISLWSNPFHQLSRASIETSYGHALLARGCQNHCHCHWLYFSRCFLFWRGLGPLGPGLSRIKNDEKVKPMAMAMQMPIWQFRLVPVLFGTFFQNGLAHLAWPHLASSESWFRRLWPKGSSVSIGKTTSKNDWAPACNLASRSWSSKILIQYVYVGWRRRRRQPT